MLKTFLLSALFFAAVLGDTPANCFWNETVNQVWNYDLSPVFGMSDSMDCTNFFNNGGDIAYSGNFTLSAPDVVEGHPDAMWTMIYNQGFEVRLHGSSLFAFFNYTVDASGVVTSRCYKTFGGWYNEPSIGTSPFPSNWRCYRAYRKLDSDTVVPSTSKSSLLKVTPDAELEALHVRKHKVSRATPAREKERFAGYSESFVKRVSEKAKSWSAAQTSLVGVPLADLARRVGFKHHLPRARAPRPPRMPNSAGARLLSPKVQEALAAVPKALPDDFSYLAQGIMGPMRDQLNCGSCYAFGTTSMFNARARIATKKAQAEGKAQGEPQPPAGAKPQRKQVVSAKKPDESAFALLAQSEYKDVLSPQRVVSCSLYSQGCDGGFPYLISKYGHDFGLVNDTSFPYMAGLTNDPIPCSLQRANSKLSFVSEYYYVGGYWGGATAELMRTEIFANGPIAVSFEVTDEFMLYRSGVFVSTGEKPEAGESPISQLVEDPNVFLLTNHVVVIAGWGVDKKSGLPYWLVENSWGASFGEGGYFKILRTTNDDHAPPGGELAIEEMPVGAHFIV